MFPERSASVLFRNVWLATISGDETFAGHDLIDFPRTNTLARNALGRKTASR
jgi:hypothetical protein